MAFVEQNGNRLTKLDFIKSRLKARILDQRDGILPVHDSDLRVWSLELAEQLDFPEFKASSNFPLRFKKKHRFASRKITKFVTRIERSNEQQIRESSVKFVQDVNSFRQENFMSFGSIWNTDQSGFEYEMTSGRTLSIKGEKETLAFVQNKSATTHSYCIQAFINANGYCAKKLFIVLQEKGGRFGPLVKQQMDTYLPPNVVV